MKPYGSKRSFDTDPRIKSARALVKREGEASIEEQTEAAETFVAGECSAGEHGECECFVCGCPCHD